MCQGGGDPDFDPLCPTSYYGGCRQHHPWPHFSAGAWRHDVERVNHRPQRNPCDVTYSCGIPPILSSDEEQHRSGHCPRPGHRRADHPCLHCLKRQLPGPQHNEPRGCIHAGQQNRGNAGCPQQSRQHREGPRAGDGHEGGAPIGGETGREQRGGQDLSNQQEWDGLKFPRLGRACPQRNSKCRKR